MNPQRIIPNSSIPLSSTELFTLYPFTPTALMSLLANTFSITTVWNDNMPKLCCFFLVAFLLDRELCGKVADRQQGERDGYDMEQKSLARIKPGTLQLCSMSSNSATWVHHTMLFTYIHKEMGWSHHALAWDPIAFLALRPFGCLIKVQESFLLLPRHIVHNTDRLLFQALLC